MPVTNGTLLLSTPALDGSYFERTVVFITEYNPQGASGFVINNLFARRFNELVEFKNCKPLALFQGGPVEQEGLFFIHRQPEIIKESVAVTANAYMGGNFKQAVEYINNSNAATANIKLFIGYCGWDAGDLETEIAEGSWMVVAGADIDTVFNYETAGLWERLYSALQ